MSKLQSLNATTKYFESISSNGNFSISDRRQWRSVRFQKPEAEAEQHLLP
ncbi:uncharacterized protein DS421_15g502130 [Arachis hypogaea]|nr:uncharacterized protein DS421_15g502130 [Arachis hypogaea]